MKELSLHILDIVQNSIRAEATEIGIEIEENPESDEYSITIRDNGFGMDTDTLKKVNDPFYTSRTTRKVGLGISLFKQNAEQTGGKLILESELGKGTVLKAVFVLSSIDRPPLGDMAGTLSILIGANPDLNFTYTHQTVNGNFILRTIELKEIMEGIPLNHPEVIKYMKELISNNLESIKVS